MSARLAKVLLTDRVTPQSELLLGRRPCTRLDLLKPNTAERVEHKQQQQKAQHDSCGKSRTFRIGEAVLLQNFTGPGWLPGKIIETSGPVSIHILLDDGRCKRCKTSYIQGSLTMDLQICQKFQ